MRLLKKYVSYDPTLHSWKIVKRPSLRPAHVNKARVVSRVGLPMAIKAQSAAPLGLKSAAPLMGEARNSSVWFKISPSTDCRDWLGFENGLFASSRAPPATTVRRNDRAGSQGDLPVCFAVQTPATRSRRRDRQRCSWSGLQLRRQTQVLRRS